MLKKFYDGAIPRLGEIVKLLNEFEEFAIQEFSEDDPTEARKFMLSDWEEIIDSSKPIRALFKKYVEEYDDDK